MQRDMIVTGHEEGSLEGDGHENPLANKDGSTETWMVDGTCFGMSCG